MFGDEATQDARWHLETGSDLPDIDMPIITEGLSVRRIRADRVSMAPLRVVGPIRPTTTASRTLKLVSAMVTTGSSRGDDRNESEYTTQYRENIMRTAIKCLAPWLAPAAIGGAIALAPIAGAVSNPTGANGSDPDPTVPYGEDPSVPYGTLPMSPYIYGYHTWDDVHSPYDVNDGVPF